MYYVYLIKSVSFPDQTYVGYTADLDERLQKHNQHSSLHTKNMHRGHWFHISLLIPSKKH
jgi:predicted GIY-YIG superfamily endonuclease